MDRSDADKWRSVASWLRLADQPMNDRFRKIRATAQELRLCSAMGRAGCTPVASNAGRRVGHHTRTRNDLFNHVVIGQLVTTADLARRTAVPSLTGERRQRPALIDRRPGANGPCTSQRAVAFVLGRFMPFAYLLRSAINQGLCRAEFGQLQSFARGPMQSLECLVHSNNRHS